MNLQETNNELISEIVEEKTALKLLEMQKRCVACGATKYLQIHHRVFRSEADTGLQIFLRKMQCIYEASYGRKLTPWHMHSIQNLVVLCVDCHEGEHGRGVHGGNIQLRKLLRYSFTCSNTGFNIPFYRKKSLFSNSY